MVPVYFSKICSGRGQIWIRVLQLMKGRTLCTLCGRGDLPLTSLSSLDLDPPDCVRCKPWPRASHSAERQLLIFTGLETVASSHHSRAQIPCACSSVRRSQSPATRKACSAPLSLIIRSRSPLHLRSLWYLFGWIRRNDSHPTKMQLQEPNSSVQHRSVQAHLNHRIIAPGERV